MEFGSIPFTVLYLSLAALTIICIVLMYYRLIRTRTKQPKIISQIAILISMNTLLEFCSWIADNYYSNNMKMFLSAFSFILPVLVYNRLFKYVCQETHKKGNIVLFSNIMAIIWVLMDVLFILTDKYYIYNNGIYTLKPLSYIALFYNMVITFLSIYFIIKYTGFNKRIRAIMLLYFLLPMAGYLLMAATYDTFVTARLTYGFSIFLTLINVHFDQAYKISEQNKKLEQDKIDIMLAQIKPHFLYNSLNTIAGLCIIDPDKAREVTLNLSQYLRSNLDSLDNKELITLSSEINHVKAYVDIEKARFLEKIDIEYNIEKIDFFLPALTIQPIVENAIKHGLCQSESGGKVIISVYEENNNYVITVVDNGVGFEKEDIDTSVTHIGIHNVKERIESLCNGTLDIESKIGEGTKVTIAIPKTDK